MANIKFTNFARSKVATGINSSATTLAITGGTGALFPALTGAEYFYLTLENSSLVREIVKVTARTADTLTIVRAQDGTTCRGMGSWGHCVPAVQCAGDHRVHWQCRSANFGRRSSPDPCGHTTAERPTPLLDTSGPTAPQV